MEIHQFVHTLTHGDAISGEALSIRSILAARGITSKIYVCHRHHELVADLVCAIEDVEREIADSVAGGGRAAILHHYSIASPLNDIFCRQQGVKKVMIYHNLTPPEWFSGYNFRVTADLKRGVRELSEIYQAADSVLADSQFNLSEIQKFGAKDAAVLPLLIDPDKWGVSSNGGIASVLRGHGGKNILFVGRIAPNKCIEDVIKAFYFYHFKIEPKSRLWIVGRDIDTEIYAFELRQLVSRLHLKDAVTFAGQVSDGELKAFYENADVYVSMSEHEGFCVPVLEAMHFNVPVVAFSSCAVPETVGDAALLVENKLPELTAELIHLAASDASLRTDLQSLGRRRLENFSRGAFEKRLTELVIDKL